MSDEPVLSPTVTPQASSEERPLGSGAHEAHLAAGSVAQQVALVVGMLTMFAVITVLARTLDLTEFGVYGLLISIPTYLLFAQGSVETIAVRAIAQAHDEFERDRAFTTALGIYLIFGLVASLLIVFGGTALLGVFRIAPGLRDQARLGLVALGAVNLAGWPAKVAQDFLRGSGKFVASATAEALGFLTCGCLMLTALALSSPLWLIIGLGGAISLVVALWAQAALVFIGLPIRVRPSTLSLPYTRSFLASSTVLLLNGITDLLIYSVDRTILGAYRPVSTVGLYEGPIRAHNLLRQLQGAMALTVMPAAAGYVAAGDRLRLRELLLRGTRYVSIVMMPFTVIVMVLAGPILSAWLGARYAAAGGAMTILVSYWLVLGGSSVGLSMMIAARRMRVVVVYSVSVALLNLTLSLALTPSLGLDGVVIGTSLPYVLLLPVFSAAVCREFAVPIATYLRDGFAMAMGTGAMLAAGELLARALLPVERPAVLTAVIIIGLTAYASFIYQVGLSPRERLLIRDTLRGAALRISTSWGRLSSAWRARGT